jgi:tRNA G46 methylase TrmB
MSPEVAAILHRKLRPGGTLFFQSDVYELALDALSAIEECDLFDNTEGEWTFLRDNPFGAKSLREVRCEEKDMRIWRMRYVPRPLSPSLAVAQGLPEER